MRRILLSLFLLLPLSANAAERPDILLIVSDDLQACLGCYDHPVCETPAIDRLASEGVLFSRAYCQYPVCGPSRASFMSGLHPHTNQVLGNNDQPGGFKLANPELADHPSIGGFLRQQGYFSARVSKIYHMGVPGGIERGDPGGDDPDSWDYTYDVMASETLSSGIRELLSPDQKHYGSSFCTVRVPDEQQVTQADFMATSQAIAILESRTTPIIPGAKNKLKQKKDSPYFLGVGLVRPHVPLIAPDRLFKKYPYEEMTLPNVPEGDLDDLPKEARGGKFAGMNEEQKKKALAAYFASVTFMDEQVGRLLDTLDRLGTRDRTIVVFTSDHGWNLGEHHRWQKMNFWEETTRVPLIISSPAHKASAGQKNSQVVELLDLYPTFAELTGLAEKAPSILEGESLVPLLVDPSQKDQDDFAITVMGRRAWSLRTQNWRYSRYPSGEELYDTESDPNEFRNLVNDPEKKAQLQKLRLQLDEVQKAIIE